MSPEHEQDLLAMTDERKWNLIRKHVRPLSPCFFESLRFCFLNIKGSFITTSIIIITSSSIIITMQSVQ